MCALEHDAPAIHVLLLPRSYSHDIRVTLRSTARFVELQQSSKLGIQNLENPSVGILVDERPVEIVDDEDFAHAAGIEKD